MATGTCKASMVGSRVLVAHGMADGAARFRVAVTAALALPLVAPLPLLLLFMTVAAATAGREWLLDTILRNHGIKSRSAAAMLAPTLAAAAAAVVRTAEVRRAEIITMMRSAVGRKQSQKQQWASIRRAVAVALVGTGVVALLAAAITIIAPFLLTPTVGALPAVLRVAVWAVNK